MKTYKLPQPRFYWIKKLICETFGHNYVTYPKGLGMREFRECQRCWHEFKIEDEVIKRFTDYCKNPRNNETRKIAVENQYCRTAWETSDKDGIIRILLTGYYNGTPSIIAFHTVEFASRFSLPAVYEKEISIEQYESLKKIFFGNYKPKYGLIDTI